MTSNVQNYKYNLTTILNDFVSIHFCELTPTLTEAIREPHLV